MASIVNIIYIFIKLEVEQADKESKGRENKDTKPFLLLPYSHFLISTIYSQIYSLSFINIFPSS